VGLLPVISALTPILMSFVSLGAQPPKASEPMKKTRTIQVCQFIVVSFPSWDEARPGHGGNPRPRRLHSIREGPEGQLERRTARVCALQLSNFSRQVLWTWDNRKKNLDFLVTSWKNNGNPEARERPWRNARRTY